MPYPPVIPPATRVNQTPQADNHPADHNGLSQALTDIVNELGANPSGPAASLDSRLAPMIGSVSAGGTALEGTVPSPLTGILISAGTMVGVVNNATAFNIPLSFPGGLLGWAAVNGDHVSTHFFCEGYAGSQNRTVIAVLLTRLDGSLVPPGSMARVNYVAVGF